MNIKDPATMFM